MEVWKIEKVKSATLKLNVHVQCVHFLHNEVLVPNSTLYHQKQWNEIQRVAETRFARGNTKAF